MDEKNTLEENDKLADNGKLTFLWKLFKFGT